MPPGRVISYTATDPDEDWPGAVTHHRNVVNVYPDEVSVSLDMRIHSQAQLRDVIAMLERAWSERQS